LQVVAVGPAQLRQALQQRRVAGLRIQIVFAYARQNAHTPHSLALLRARRERPRRGAAEQLDESAAGAHSITSSARGEKSRRNVERFHSSPPACLILRT
jgi:hypothetical protein